MRRKSKISLVVILFAVVTLANDDGIIIRNNQRTLEQIDDIYSQMPSIRYSPSPERCENLPRTKKILTDGGILRIVMLGDSIVNDTSRSCWNLLVEKRYPICKIEKITSVRGSTGCWWYKEPGRVQKFVLDHKPDLVIIGGISHRGDIDSIRDVISQIRAESNADILLMTGAFGNVDPRDDEQWHRISNRERYGEYRKGLEELALKTGAAFLDMEAAWAGYVRESDKELDWFKRDPIHANERGEQILGRILESYFSLPVFVTPSTGGKAGSGNLTVVDEKLFPNLFVWTDTCNVYVIRDGDAALLIDLGDAGVLEHLPQIGVQNVEWILFTHHHREQCQGYPRLKGKDIKIAGPEAERALFERPASFRKMKPTLGDAFTVYGSSYIRPPLQPIRLDRGFSKTDTFTWHGYEFRCMHTPGNSPGGMSYILRREGRWIAFSGDVMLDGARMHNWFDTEWDYGFAAGIYAIHNSAAMLEDFDPALLLASHGPVVREPKPQLREYQQKLRLLERMLVRGYPVNTFAAADQDRVSKPTTVPGVWQITPHMFKFKGPDFWPNFTLILADSGNGLVVDCGLLDTALLDKSIEMMQERLGLKKIDAVIITHMHGDHFLQAPHLREKWDAQIWTLDRIADKCEHPERYNYAAAIQTYGEDFDSVNIDRVFKSGETFKWEDYEFTVDWMPGQTEFALCLHGLIDGRKVAFTGDIIFGNPADPAQTGHEALVAHNSAILEEGYLYVADYLRRLDPDLIIGGHSFVLNEPAAMLERFYDWTVNMRSTFQSLSTDEDYRYWFDPFWVRAEPYRVTIKRGRSDQLLLHVRNFRRRVQEHHIEIHTPTGLVVEPSVLQDKISGESQEIFPIRLKAAEDAPAGIAIIAVDVTLDGRRYGQWFDFIVEIE